MVQSDRETPENLLAHISGNPDIHSSYQDMLADELVMRGDEISPWENRLLYDAKEDNDSPHFKAKVGFTQAMKDIFTSQPFNDDLDDLKLIEDVINNNKNLIRPLSLN